ncbi:hypothetical protein ACFZCF_16860 [Streptomyces sp. NPDC007945]|uniref:hypothetical protein n=1 Tax=Streptomyces sp. NPDC007945 TaxID=3364797 RepID=UPI0036EF6BF6
MPPRRRALVSLVHLRRYERLTRIADDAGVSVSTVHSDVAALVEHLPHRAPVLLRVLCET